ncbi:MAG: hypothetical protein FWF96_06785 [Kiritimatiellaeota bacterium]|nr:hypothetical protein [Kiritimatiellota bacterium]
MMVSMRYNYPKKALAPLFKQRGVTLFQHGADKFEFRFQAPVRCAVFVRAAPMVFGTLVAALCLGVVFWLTRGNRAAFIFGVPLYAGVAGVCLFLSLKLFRRRIAPRLFANAQSHGLVCDAKRLGFTVWNRLSETTAAQTLLFRDVADVTVFRGNRLALATRDGRVLPFTRPIDNPDAAEALRRFIKNLATLDDSTREPHWQETETPQSGDPKALYVKRNNSTPMRFSKRVSRKAPKHSNKRYFTPGSPE